MLDKNFLIVVGGPTASGKTGFAIRLAQHFQTAIISSDSRQFYKEMTIGTAKPSAEELAQAPHYLIDSLSIEQYYSVGDFERDALKLLEQLFEKYQVIILSGGSGLFINALCQGLDNFPGVPSEIKTQIEQEYEEKGLKWLQEQIRVHDPAYFTEVDIQNPHRLIRALCVCRASGEPYSSFRKGGEANRSFTPVYLQMNWLRPQLYARINKRVDLMIAEGLLAEAKLLSPQKNLSALQTVGYQELFSYFDGEINQEEAIELIKRNSRRYAKRQLTWARRDGFWKKFHPTDWEHCLDYLKLFMTQETSVKTGTAEDWQNLTGKTPELNDRIQLIMSFKAGIPTAGIRLVQLKELYIVEELVERADVPTISMLIHETIERAMDTPLFVMCRWAKMALFKQFGFETIPFSDAPEIIQKRYEEELSDGLQTILMQKVK